MTTIRVVRVSLVDRLSAFTESLACRILCVVLVAGVMMGLAVGAFFIPAGGVPSGLLIIIGLLALLECWLIFDLLFIEMPKLAEGK